MALDWLWAWADQDQDIQYRLLMWTVAPQAIIAQPWLGYGYDGFNLMFNPGIRADRAHNVILDWTLWYGIGGGAAYIAFIWLLIRRALLSARLLTVALIAQFTAAQFFMNGVCDYVSLAMVAAFLLGGTVDARASPPETSGPR